MGVWVRDRRGDRGMVPDRQVSREEMEGGGKMWVEGGAQGGAGGRCAGAWLLGAEQPTL